MTLVLTLLFLNLNGSGADWSVYFENEKTEISFKDALCDDIKNGVSFY